MKNMSEISYNALLLSYREISFIHEETAYEELDKRCLKFRTMPCYFHIGEISSILEKTAYKELEKNVDLRYLLAQGTWQEQCYTSSV